MGENVIGRERELATAETFLDRLQGGACAFALEGDAGIGKTALLEEIAERAMARAYAVLLCRPTEVEAKLSFVSLADLFAGVGDDVVCGLTSVQRLALEVALLRREPAGIVDPRAVSAAVVSTLAALARKRAAVVAIDDAQWLDASSAHALEFAARRVGSAQIGFLISVRTDAVPLPLGLERAFSGERVERVPLGPLSRGALQRLLGARLPSPFPRPVLARIERASGGNPFFALEIGRALRGAGAIDPGMPLPIPESLRGLVEGRLSGLASEAREALLAAAALAHPTVDLLELASSAAGVAAAEESGLLGSVDHGRVSFAHPLYASAVYLAAAASRRRRMHRRLAAVVGEPEERARHLALAAEGPDEEVAAALEEAAGLARARGAWDAAGELLERARRLTPPDRLDHAWRRGLRAAEHHVHAGDRTRGRTLLEEILADDLPGPVRAEALCLLGGIRVDEGRIAEGIAFFASALEHADDARLAGMIEHGLGFARAYILDHVAALEHSRRALELAKATGERPLIAEALSRCAMYGFLSGREVDWGMVERSLDLADPDRVTPLSQRPGMVAAALMLYVGRSEARERLLAVRDAMVERGDESDLAFVCHWLCWLERRCGNFSAAAAWAEEAAELAESTGSQSMYAWALSQRALVHAHRGDIAQTRSACAEAAGLIETEGASVPMLWLAGSLGLLELSLGNAASAWRACALLTERIERNGIDAPVVVEFLPDALEALVALGQLDRAEALLDTFEGRGRELERAWTLAAGGRCRGLLLAARGDLDGAVRVLERALTEHRRLEMPFELARCLLVQGQVRRRRREKRLARESLTRSLELFERIGAPLWAERARGEIERLGLRAAPGELTQTERKVAELAGSGMTNKEIAASLFVSPRTVQANLVKVYKKLGIRTRAELGGRMVERRGAQGDALQT